MQHHLSAMVSLLHQMRLEIVSALPTYAGANMTDQELFDRVVTHLAKQGRRAMARVACLYRTPDGLKCAIGCLIPDEKYRAEMELDPDIWEEVMEVAGISDEQDWLARQLQRSHDSSTTAELLRSNLLATARAYKLDPHLIGTITTWQ